jgi:hypothetical protein
MKGTVTVVVWFDGDHSRVTSSCVCWWMLQEELNWVLNLTVASSSTLTCRLASVNIVLLFEGPIHYTSFQDPNVWSSWMPFLFPIFHVIWSLSGFLLSVTLLFHCTMDLLLSSCIKTPLWFIVQYFWAHLCTKLA